MSILTGSIEELMTPQLIDKLSAKSGVPGAQVRTGMNGAVASILDGLATKAHDPRAMNQVADLVHATPVGGETVFEDESAMQRSSNQLLGVVGGDSQGFVQRLARYTGVGAGAATGFVGAAAALVIGAFRKLGRSRGGLDASGLASTLIDEQRELHAAVPQGLMEGTGARVANVSTNVRERAETTASRTETGVRRTGQAVAEAPHRRSWLLPVLLLGGLIALIALWAGRRHNTPMTTTPTTPRVTTPATPSTPNVTPPATTTPNVTAPKPATPATNMPAAPAMTQPAAPALTFPAGTAESKLADELKTPTSNPAWIELDAKFDTGKATLQPGAEDQLGNIAKALAAYPNARVRVGGYTDSTGNTEANQKLSDARAQAVRQELISRGIDGSRIEAQGYGQERPVAQGAEQQANRRAAIQVIQ